MNSFARWTGAEQVSTRISARDRRTLLMGAMIVFGLLATFRGIPAWRAWVAMNQATTATLRTRLAIARQTTRNARVTDQQADSLARHALGIAPALIAGDSPAQATAALASYLSEIAATAGVRLSGVQLTVDSAKKGVALFHVRVQADGSGDVRGMATLFQLLESGHTPLVSVKAFSLSQSDPNAPANHAETLHATFVLEVLARRSDDR